MVFGVPSADKARGDRARRGRLPAGRLSYEDVLAWCRAHLAGAQGAAQHRAGRAPSRAPRAARSTGPRCWPCAGGPAGEAERRRASRAGASRRSSRASVGLHARGLAAAARLAPASWPAGRRRRCSRTTWSSPPPACLAAQPLARPQPHAPARRARGELVALTFDDGPDPEVTPRGARPPGRGAARARPSSASAAAPRRIPSWPRRSAAADIGIENHTYSHPNAFAFFSRGGHGARDPSARRTRSSAPPVAAPRLFRAPAGIRNPWLDRVLARRGLRLVSWTRRGSTP